MREVLKGKLHFLPRSYLEAGVAALLRPFDVVLTMGAGDITQAGPLILRTFQERAPKIKAALLFGGASVEHDVSLMSMQTMLEAMRLELYEIVPIGITREGNWGCGFDLGKNPSSVKIPPAVLEEISSCDVAIAAMHGSYGEDGMIAAILEALAIPY